MKNKKIIVIIIVLVLTVVNAISYFKILSLRSNLDSIKVELNSNIKNKKVASFQKLFIDKVLMSDGNVDFNTRVELQNAVTDINDATISKAWDSFLGVKTEIEAQKKVKELLFILANKVY